MRETSDIVSTQDAGVVEEVTDKKGAEIHACMTAKGLTDVYLGRSVYITIANFGEVDENLPKHQRVGETAEASAETGDI